MCVGLGFESLMILVNGTKKEESELWAKCLLDAPCTHNMDLINLGHLLINSVYTRAGKLEDGHQAMGVESIRAREGGKRVEETGVRHKVIILVTIRSWTVFQIPGPSLNPTGSNPGSTFRDLTDPWRGRGGLAEGCL